MALKKISKIPKKIIKIFQNHPEYRLIDKLGEGGFAVIYLANFRGED